MKNVIVEDRSSLEAVRMQWQDPKMSKLEHYIANVNPQCWPQYNAKMLEHHILVPTPMNLGSPRALTLLRNRSHKLGDDK